MPAAIVTGAGGLIGAECVRELVRAGFDVVGIDNDMRGRFFGPAASTRPVSDDLVASLPEYRHADVDIRDEDAMCGTLAARRRLTHERVTVRSARRAETSLLHAYRERATPRPHSPAQPSLVHARGCQAPPA